MSVIENTTEYVPYVHPDSREGIAATAPTAIAPEFRVGNPPKGDELALYIGNRGVQWSLVAQELETKAESAEAAGYLEDAADLLGRADKAKQKATLYGYVWLEEG